MLRFWRVTNKANEVLFEHAEEAVARRFWSERKDAAGIVSVVSHEDEINLIDLIARASKGEKTIAADQSEDEEYFKRSSVLQRSPA